MASLDTVIWSSQRALQTCKYLVAPKVGLQTLKYVTLKAGSNLQAINYDNGTPTSTQVLGGYARVSGAANSLATAQIWNSRAVQSLKYTVPTVARLQTVKYTEPVGTGNLQGLTYFIPAASQTLQPTGITSAGAFGTAAVKNVDHIVVSTGIASGAAIGTANFTNASTLLPTGIAPGGIGSPTLLPGARELEVTGIASAAAVGTARVVPTNNLLIGAGIGSAEAFGAAPNLYQFQDISPVGIDSGQAIGTPAVTTHNDLFPPGIYQGGIGTPNVVPHNDLTVTAGIASAEALGVPNTLTIEKTVVTGIPSGQALGSPELFTFNRINPLGIGGGGSTPTTLVVVGIAADDCCGKNFGRPNVEQPQSITVATGIPSAEGLGFPDIVRVVNIIPVGIPPGGMGQPNLRAVSIIAPEGIDQSGVGVPNLDSLTQYAFPTGISSEEAFGQPECAQGEGITTSSTTTTPPPPPGLVEGRPATVPEAMDALLARGGLRKKTRFTRLIVEYPLAATPPFFRLPYNLGNGVPVIAEEFAVRNVTSYQVQEGDNMLAAQLNLRAANTEAGAFSQMLRENELLRVEERYSNAEGWTTGWMVIGTFLIDSVNPTSEGATSEIDIVGRDVFKLLTFPGFEENLQADKIRVPRRRLAFQKRPTRDNVSYYLLVDGAPDEHGAWKHTYNWASPPVPRLFKKDTNERVSYREGSVQILYGTGEIVIDQEYFESLTKQGGLELNGDNHPDRTQGWIEAEYARYCLPEDERRYEIDAIDGDGKTVYLKPGRVIDADADTALTEGLYSWQNGMTVVALGGSAKNQRYTITAINPSRFQIVLDRAAYGEGLTVGDLVRIGESSRIEHVIERMLLMAGFQNIDSIKPFYMEIAKPNTAFTDPGKRDFQLTLPSVEDFDYRNDKRTSFQEAWDKIRTLIPPFMALYANEHTHAVYRATDQAATAQYVLASDVTQGLVESNDQEIFTRVVYHVRDKEYRNIAYLGNKPVNVTHFHFYNSTLNSDPDGEFPHGNVLWRGSGDSYARIWYDDHDNDNPAPQSGPVQDRFNIRREFFGSFGPQTTSAFETCAYYAVCDADARSSLVVRDDHAGSDHNGEFDGLPVFHLEFDRSYRLKEIHLTCWPWKDGVNTAKDQYWFLEWSLDGEVWEPLGDEFNFSDDGTRNLTTSDFGLTVDAKYLRFSISQAAKFRYETTGSLGIGHHGNKRAFASMATVQVFADDVIEGTVELGVDRFDKLVTVTAAGPGFIEVSEPVEATWLTKNIWVTPVGQIAAPTGYSGHRFLVSGNPTLAGVGPGATVTIERGETETDFAVDQERRRRLGRRTFTVPEVDETGYYIVQQLKQSDPTYDLKRYAEDKAREYLAELSQEFLPMTATAVRPDARLRDTCHINLERLGFEGDALIREITRNGDGTVQVKATPFRDVAIRTYTESVTVTTTNTLTTTSSTTSSTLTTSSTSSSSTSSTSTTISTQHVRRATLGGMARVS